jgi:hypothetical protein
MGRLTMAEEKHSTITVYSDTLTLDEFESMLGPEFMDDSAWEVETVCWEDAESADPRHLYWSARHYELEPAEAADQIIELRTDVTRVEVRTANYDAMPDDAVSASIHTRDRVVHFELGLVPVGMRDRIGSINTIRRESGDAAAWLVVGDLLNLITEGSQL